MVKLSIITINYNNKNGLEKTIESVVNQTFSDIEYIVIDGGSEDGSVEVIKQYSDKITYWVSEPDEGIYNAMNKGILRAKGEYCLFLNSGDFLANNEVLYKLFEVERQEDLLICRFYRRNDEGNRIEMKEQKITFLEFYVSSLPHAATLIKRNLFEKIGLYNENNKIVSDWEFFMEALFIHRSSHFVIDDLFLSEQEKEGISASSMSLHLQERKNVLKNKFPLFIDDYRLLRFYMTSKTFRRYKQLIEVLLPIRKLFVK